MISEQAWTRLVGAEHDAMRAGWALPGVFATAVGPSFRCGSPDSLLYVGKSGGPRIEGVGISGDQAHSAAAAREWMLGRRNSSAFWAFADQLTDSRESMAWSNIVRIDCHGDKPPTLKQWRQVRQPCLDALLEELNALRPGRTVFVTNSYCRDDIKDVLMAAGYHPAPTPAVEGIVAMFDHPSLRSAAILRHPQGWTCGGRDAAARFLRLRPAA